MPKHYADGQQHANRRFNATLVAIANADGAAAVSEQRLARWASYLHRLHHAPPSQADWEQWKAHLAAAPQQLKPPRAFTAAQALPAPPTAPLAFCAHQYAASLPDSARCVSTRNS